jgi:hypothetical protein
MIAMAVAAVVSVVGILAAYLTGRSTKTTKEAQSRADTFERASHADTGNPDGSTDLDWLRKRGKR